MCRGRKNVWAMCTDRCIACIRLCVCVVYSVYTPGVYHMCTAQVYIGYTAGHQVYIFLSVLPTGVYNEYAV